MRSGGIIVRCKVTSDRRFVPLRLRLAEAWTSGAADHIRQLTDAPEPTAARSSLLDQLLAAPELACELELLSGMPDDGQPIIPGRIGWLRAEMLKTRVAHGYCSRQLAAEACPYANICEQCDNYVTAPEFIPQLQNQLADTTALRDDAAERGWHTEVARHHASSPASRAICND